MDEYEDIEKLFLKTLEDNEEFPSLTAWMKVKSNLDQDIIQYLLSKQKRIIAFSFLFIFLLMSLVIHENIKILRLHSPLLSKSEVMTQNIVAPKSRKKYNSFHRLDNTIVKRSESLLNFNYESKNRKAYTNEELPAIISGKVTKNDAPIKNLIFDSEEQRGRRNNDRIQCSLGRVKPFISSLKPSFKALGPIPAVLLTQKTKHTHNFYLQAFFSQDFNFFHLKNNRYSTLVDNASESEKNENHDLSFTVGVIGSYNYNKLWGMQLGVSYSSLNVIVQPKIIYATKDNYGNIKYRLNTSSGYGYFLPSFNASPANGDSIGILSSTHNLQYISIPFGLKYSFGKGKVNFTITEGVSANFLLKGQMETIATDNGTNEIEIINDIQGLKKLYFSGTSSFAFNYQINDRLTLSAIPNIRFALNSINRNNPISTYPNAFGVALALNVKL